MEWYEQQNKWFDCFEVLGLTEDASLEEIKKAYRDLSKKYHPDNKVDGNQEMFEKVKLAYETLKEQEKREKYIAFLKACKKNNNNTNQEENISFEDIVKDYKEKEKQIKVAINVMISKVEKKEKQFSQIYNEFCEVLKEGTLNINEFEIRKQKLRSVELSNINSILEIQNMINSNLIGINLSYEKKKLKQLLSSFKEKDSILTSTYKQAIIKLKLSTIRFKKRYAALIPISIILAGIYLSNNYLKEQNNEKDTLEESLESSVNEALEKEANEDIIKNEEVINDDELIVSKPDEINKYKDTDCILFQEVSEDIEYDKIYKPLGSDSLAIMCAEKDGIDYILDEKDNSILLANILSWGGPYYDFDGQEFNKGTEYIVCLGKDGYDYTIDTSDFRTILEKKDTYYDKSPSFYLEGYGNVFEAKHNGFKYMLDAETRYPLVKCYETYEPVYYDEELGCNVYCFIKDSNDKYYVQASDLTKVLKIDFANLKNEKKFIDNCILFKEDSKDFSYDEMSEPFKLGEFEVIEAKKDGINYLLDSKDYHVLASNFYSYDNYYIGGTEYNDGTEIIKFYGIDNCYYYVKSSDLKTILGVASVFCQESNLFYLEGFGNVIEGTGFGGEKTLIDAETRQSLLIDSEGYKIYYTNYNGIYYDEELGCNVYSFTSDYYGENYYFATSDFKEIFKKVKVLKKEENN